MTGHGPEAEARVAAAYVSAGLLVPKTLRRSVITLIDVADREDAIDALEVTYNQLDRRTITKLVDLAREALNPQE